MQDKIDSLVASAEITLTVEYDDTPLRGNAMASDDADFDKQVEDEILERLDSGDVWAWAHVRVTASVEIDGYGTVEASASLGGCNYLSEQDFRECEYDGMESEARDALRAEIFEQAEHAAELLHTLGTL